MIRRHAEAVHIAAAGLIALTAGCAADPYARYGGAVHRDVDAAMVAGFQMTARIQLTVVHNTIPLDSMGVLAATMTRTAHDVRERATEADSVVFVHGWGLEQRPPPGARCAGADRRRGDSYLRDQDRDCGCAAMKNRVVFARRRRDLRGAPRGMSGDLRDLFHLNPDNTCLVKVSYWLNR